MTTQLSQTRRFAWLGLCSIALAALVAGLGGAQAGAAGLLLTPNNIVADNFNAVNGGASALAVATDGVINPGASGQVNGFDNWHGDSSDPTFGGLTYGSLETFGDIKMYMGHQFVDGGNFTALPSLYVLTNNVYTGTTRPSDDPTDWTLVSPSHYTVVSGSPSATDAVGAGPTLPYNYALTTPISGYGWALEGFAPGTPHAGGSAPFSFISMTELQAFSAPEPGSFVLAGFAALCGLGLVVRRNSKRLPASASRSAGWHKATCALLACAVLLTLAAVPAVANPIIPATAIMGLNAGGASTATTGTPYSQFEGTAPASLNDGNLGTFDTTFYGGAGPAVPDSYVGLMFNSPQTLPGLDLNVSFHTFVDGGWFGKNNDTPTPPTTIASALVAPVVQTTTDGINWTTVPSASNYLSTLSSLTAISQVANNVTFSISGPLTGIEGVRLIGLSGGTAGTNQGFVGVAEINATTPEPSTLVLGGLGLIGLVVAARRRRR